MTHENRRVCVDALADAAAQGHTGYAAIMIAAIELYRDEIGHRPRYGDPEIYRLEQLQEDLRIIQQEGAP